MTSEDVSPEFILGVARDFLLVSRIVLIPRPYERLDIDPDENEIPLYSGKRSTVPPYQTYHHAENSFLPEHEENRAYF